MPTFRYVARTTGGESARGQIEAEDKAAAVRLLADRQLFALDVTEHNSAGGAKRRATGRIKPRRQADALRELADLLRAGVALNRSIEVLAAHTEDSILRVELEHIRFRVSEGAPLADALAESALGRNDPLLVNMVRAGEAGGFLEESLYRHSEFIERNVELRRNISGQLAYPAILFTISITALVVLLVFFVPKFQDLFVNQFAGRELPGPTAALMKLSEFLQRNGLLVLLIFGVVAVAIWRIGSTEAGRMAIGRLKLRLPLVGRVLRSFTIARFSRTLGTLLKSGVPLLGALEISKTAAGNCYVERVVGDMIGPIERGESPARLFAASDVFPQTVSEMLAVGEDTGEMDRVLLNIAERYEREAVSRLSILVRLIEPVIIVMMSGLVLFVIISVLVPLLELQQMI